MSEIKLLTDIKHLLLEYVNQSPENAFTVRRDVEILIDDVMMERFLKKRREKPSPLGSTH